jgi:hypothetical protein
MADPGAAGPCWCTALPAAVPLPRDAGAGCWCPQCLKRHIDGQTPPAGAPPTQPSMAID